MGVGYSECGFRWRHCQSRKQYRICGLGLYPLRGQMKDMKDLEIPGRNSWKSKGQARSAKGMLRSSGVTAGGGWEGSRSGLATPCHLGIPALTIFLCKGPLCKIASVDLLTEPLKLSPAHFACSLDCEPVEIWSINFLQS